MLVFSRKDKKLHPVNIWAGRPGQLTACRVLFSFQLISEAVMCDAGGSRQHPFKTNHN